ncbi:MAG: aspartate ammonia-lyase [Micrococcales bacterium]|nr:aspartate ammonia-lyase [Micrococcales bacterium]NBR61521.1 aspartate ammonia-lyase [Actinomycetota bacterium]NBS60850.1 aspartate ammonia-lyase [Microbacteriaceae bacterium]NBT47598.1 aspartate ammonia-lyase [Actinomycetota bacterium]NBY43725.1 aspartate ammonia-lyase [Micrococcales bacterium]
MSATRREHDLLGNFDIPISAYWGVHTARAAENFPITGVPIGHYRSLIKALAIVKEATAKANLEVGELDEKVASAIIGACHEVAAGKFDKEFIVDAIQGGAGTSTNMNANEVIANRALELSGHQKGEYEFIHPLNDVNMSQSTNDVYPTALKVALILEIRELITAMQYLRASYTKKAEEFKDVIKMGRTQLQDAVPMTLGQEFATFARMTQEDEQRLAEVIPLLSEINLGGTAIGTGLNAPAGYAEAACRHLSELAGWQFSVATDMVEATQDTGVFVLVSGVLKRVAVKLSKEANDLRLLSSGPRAGLGEINLPARQAGSSIMPGKVNPVIPEVVNQIAFTVIGNDMTVTMACEGGQLQLNAFEPIITRALMMSIIYLRRGCYTLADRCVDGITANVDKLRKDVEHSIGTVTALSPTLGYENATLVAQTALAENSTVKEVVLRLGLMTEAEFDSILGDVDKLVRPNG